MIEPPGLRSMGQKTQKLSDELKELINVVTELETKLNDKILEVDKKLIELNETIDKVING